MDLESPRVKNVPLKCYFSLPYFIMVFVELESRIKQEEAKMEAALFATLSAKIEKEN